MFGERALVCVLMVCQQLLGSVWSVKLSEAPSGKRPRRSIVPATLFVCKYLCVRRAASRPRREAAGPDAII